MFCIKNIKNVEKRLQNLSKIPIVIKLFRLKLCKESIESNANSLIPKLAGVKLAMFVKLIPSKIYIPFNN